MKKTWKALDTLKDVDTGVSGSDALNIIEQALTELERLKKFKETFDNYELAKRQDFIAFENWLECERELTVLKRDVKQFIELLMKDNHTERDTFDIEILKDKLLEGGKEE